MAPGPSISARVTSCRGSIRILGETFQPCPHSRAQPAPVPSVAIAAAPFAPVKFSALMLRVFAWESRAILPRPRSSPLNPSIDLVTFEERAWRPGGGAAAKQSADREPDPALDIPRGRFAG